MRQIASPFEKFLLVCENEREDTACCAPEGSLLREALKQKIKDLKLNSRVRVSRTGCLDLCAKGPSILMVPDMVWYQEVCTDDLDAIISDCLFSLCDKSLPPPSSFIPYLQEGNWQGIESKIYKEESASSFRNIRRKTLIGREAPSVPFELRYFELGLDGFSSLEGHEHAHVVIITRGTGEVIVNDKMFTANANDIFYIGPGEAHQFQQSGIEPFGFYCMVSKMRDKPVLLADHAKQRLMAIGLNPKG